MQIGLRLGALENMEMIRYRSRLERIPVRPASKVNRRFSITRY
jgi:hypothetical protein